ncbi:MAG: flavodoxin family protein [Acidobacteria bacterium]|nr:MAG: flavodoxin family protein [Acidobacteriota bacterium]
MSAKAIILLATLMKTGQSNTELLSEFFADRAKKKDLDCEIVKLVDRDILAGTYSDMGDGDDWPSILDRILDASIILFATPVWWGNQSSEMQRVIERLDELHDEILEGKTSRLDGKVGGIIITGDSDGAQHIIANLANFFNAVGLALPPYATLSVLSEKLKKGSKATREEKLALFEKDYAKTADKMIAQLVKFAR